MKADSVNVKVQEERKAAVSAKAQLGYLTPSSARTHRIIFRLRYAANVAAYLAPKVVLSSNTFC